MTDEPMSCLKLFDRDKLAIAVLEMGRFLLGTFAILSITELRAHC